MMDEKIKPEERLKCPACGRTVSQRWDFCPKCRCCLKKPAELSSGMKISLNVGVRTPESSFPELQNMLIEDLRNHLRAVEEVHFALMALIRAFERQRTAGSASDTRFYVKELFETDVPAVVTDKLQSGNWIVLAAYPRNGKNIFCLGRIS